MKNLIALSTNYILLHNSMLAYDTSNNTVVSTEPFSVYYNYGAITISNDSIYSHITTSYMLLKNKL